jgi:hypothetical protein
MFPTSRGVLNTVTRVRVFLDGVSDWISDPLTIYRSPPQATITVSLNYTLQVKVTLRLTVSQSVSLGVEPQPDIYYCLTITVLFLWGALSDERTGLSFIYAAGPRQRSLSRVRVPWDS